MAAIECNFPRPGGGGAGAHEPLRTWSRSSTSSATSSTTCSAKRSSRRSQARASRATSSSRPRRCSRSGPGPRRRSISSPCTTRPESRSRRRSTPRCCARAASVVRSRRSASSSSRRSIRPTTRVRRPSTRRRCSQEVNDAYTPFKYVDGTHFQASFGHLIGYDAGYYGYQWALSIAQDLFTRFKKEGLLNAKTAADYRAAVLAMGSKRRRSEPRRRSSSAVRRATPRIAHSSSSNGVTVLAIKSVSARRLDIPMKKAFGIAGGAQEVARNVLVEITLASGVCGWGEGAPLPAVQRRDPGGHARRHRDGGSRAGRRRRARVSASSASGSSSSRPWLRPRARSRPRSSMRSRARTARHCANCSAAPRRSS